jgi:hypothetical protein
MWGMGSYLCVVPVFGRRFEPRAMPPRPGKIVVLPCFAPMRRTAPRTPRGMIAGMTLETTLSEILRGIIEGSLFPAKNMVESIISADAAIDEFRVVGGGSRSAARIFRTTRCAMTRGGKPAVWGLHDGADWLQHVRGVFRRCQSYGINRRACGAEQHPSKRI